MFSSNLWNFKMHNSVQYSSAAGGVISVHRGKYPYHLGEKCQLAGIDKFSEVSSK